MLTEGSPLAAKRDLGAQPPGVTPSQSDSSISGPLLISGFTQAESFAPTRLRRPAKTPSKCTRCSRAWLASFPQSRPLSYYRAAPGKNLKILHAQYYPHNRPYRVRDLSRPVMFRNGVEALLSSNGGTSACSSLGVLCVSHCISQAGHGAARRTSSPTSGTNRTYAH